MIKNEKKHTSRLHKAHGLRSFQALILVVFCLAGGIGIVYAIGNKMTEQRKNVTVSISDTGISIGNS